MVLQANNEKISKSEVEATIPTIVKSYWLDLRDSIANAE